MATLPPIDESFEIPAQLKPIAGILTDFLVVDDNDQFIASTISVSNGSGFPDYFYISFAQAGASDAPSQYLYQNCIVNPYDTFRATCGDTLSGTDVIRVKSLFGNLVFSISGVRLTPI